MDEDEVYEDELGDDADEDELDEDEEDDDEPYEGAPYAAALNRWYTELEKLEVFVRLCMVGLHVGMNASQVRDEVRDAAKALNRPNTAEPEQLAKLEAFANAERKQEFPYLYGIAATRLWSMLEAYVDEVVVARIRARAVSHKTFEKIKGQLVPFMLASENERAEILIEKLKDLTEAPLKKGVGRFEELLNVVGAGGGVENVVRDVLYELSEARNAIIHRSGMADPRFRKACPQFGAPSGEILLTSRHYDRYRQAVIWYAFTIDSRIAVARGEQVTESHQQFLRELTAIIMQSLEPPTRPS